MSIAANKNTTNPTDIYEPPTYDPILKSGSLLLSTIWMGWFSNFYQTIISYLTQNGFLIPPLSNEQRDALVGPIGGQMIYNTTTNVVEIFYITSLSPLEGVWHSI